MNEGRSRPLQTLCMLLIFALFAASALLLVLAAAGAFRGVSARVESSGRIRTSLAYVMNKVRAGDESGAVALENEGNVRALVISSQAGGEACKTYLYWHGGYLKELFLAADQPFAPEDGEQIERLSGFSVRKAGRLLTVTAAGPEGETLSAAVCLRSS